MLDRMGVAQLRLYIVDFLADNHNKIETPFTLYYISKPHIIPFIIMACNDYQTIHNHFQFHIDEFNKLNKSASKMHRKWYLDSCKYYHLCGYRHKLMGEWREETNEVKKRAIQLKRDHLSNTIWQLKKDLDVLYFHYDISHYQEDFHHTQFNMYMKKLDKCHYITKKNSRVSRVTKSRARQLETEECCICLNTHCIRDITKTSCGHTFGKSCIENMRKNYDAVACPLCRNSQLEYTIYTIK